MPPMRAGDLRELDDFVGRRERARHVEETGAQAERAVLHALPDQPAHACSISSGVAARLIFAHHRAADRSLPDESWRSSA